MSIEKTLAGDRLGSGNKMKVTLNNYERSTHDLSYMFRSSMSAGTLVPFMSEIALPGDTFDIDLEANVLTHPTVGPLFGSYKLQLDVFEAPIRLYNSLLHNNMLGIGFEMSKVKLPIIHVTGAQTSNTTENWNNAQINSSCILKYLGISGVGNTGDGTDRVRTFNGVPLLAYWEIYKNYYANKQEEKGAVIHRTLPIEYDEMEIDKVEIQDVTSAVWKEIGQSGVGVVDAVVIGVTNSPLGPYFNLANRVRVTVAGQFNPWAINIYNAWGKLMFNLGEVTSLVYGNLNTWTQNGNVWESQITLSNYQTTQLNQGGFGHNLAIRYIQNAYDPNTQKEPAKEPTVATFPLKHIDNMRKAVLAYNSESAPFEITSQNIPPYSWLYAKENLLSTQEGLALKTYQSDLFNNWLKTEYIDAINLKSAISTAGGSITVDQINLANKVYNMLNRIAVSGGTYDDWLDAVWTGTRIRRAESPIYHGGLIRELVFQEVVSTAETGNVQLGELAGKGVMAKKHKGGKIVIKVDEPSYIIGIVSLTPRVDYSQGNKWDVNLKTLDDLHKPQLDQIGFQDLITEQMAYWDTKWNGTQWVQKSAGKQPAWLNYMTNVNRTYGSFAEESEMYMTLNRRYEQSASGSIQDLTTYIDPKKFNFIFASTAIDAQNFWTQIAVNITARRKMSAKVIPNL